MAKKKKNTTRVKENKWKQNVVKILKQKNYSGACDWYIFLLKWHHRIIIGGSISV